MTGQTVDALLARYGQKVEVVRDGAARSARAFLQPILDRGRETRQFLPTPLGVRREDRFLCLGREELRADRDQVRWLGGLYDVQTAQPIYVGGALSHWWAVLVPADKEEA